MNNNLFQYKPLDPSDLNMIYSKHLSAITSFLLTNGYDGNKINISQDLILSIIVKVHQRKKYFEYFHRLNMSELKEAALNSFWYIKLRPIIINDTLEEETNIERIKYDSINEKMALFLILSTLRSLLNEQKLSTQRLNTLPKGYLDELVYSFTYRDISKEAMIILVESMAVCLGLNPYSEKE